MMVIELLINISTVISLWMIILRRNKSGYIVGIISSIFWIIFLINLKSYIALFTPIFCCFMYVYCYKKWK